MKFSSKAKPRTLPPDALLAKKRGRTRADARRYRRKIYRGALRLDSGALSPPPSAVLARPALRDGDHRLLQGTRRGKFPRLHELSWRRRLSAPAFGGHRRNTSARRIPHLVYAVTAGKQPGHVEG